MGVQDTTLFVDRIDFVLKKTQVTIHTAQILDVLVKSAKSRQIKAFGKNHGKRRKLRKSWLP